ncbi:hypothetical protein WJX75_004376 [Coccomyxa subellipsoidea]|uniref:Uncharacterized protein n=1 Tax=Coccomyxa subellipsoidea TaxID=248742 RepID=A0ABR2YRZ3_9CHLO
MVASAIQGGYTGDPSQLSFLDLHDGYSPDEARALLTAWGPYGRRLYFLVEGIDCTLYHAGYRGFLVVVANQLARGLKSKWPPAGNLALLAVLPVLLAAIDFLEDAGQVAMVFAYEKSIPEEAWGALVGAASFVNQSKWVLCRCTVTSLVVEAVALFGLTYLIPSATENGTNGEK